MISPSVLHSLHASPPLGTTDEEYRIGISCITPVTEWNWNEWSLWCKGSCGDVELGCESVTNQICRTFPEPGYQHLSARVHAALQPVILASRVLPVFESNWHDFVLALRNGDSVAVDGYRAMIDKEYDHQYWFEDLLQVPELNIRTTVCGVLLKKYRPLILKRIQTFSRIKAHSQVEDVAGEVAVKVLKTIHNYEPRACFPSWLARITDNTCIDCDRKLRRSFEPKLVIDTSKEQDWLGDYVNRDTVDAIKDVLTKEEYELLFAYFVDGVSLQVIATAMKCSISTAMRMIIRIKDKIRKTLSDHDFPPNGKEGREK